MSSLHLLALASLTSLFAATAAAQRAPLTITSASAPMTLTVDGPDGAQVTCNTPCRLAVEPGAYRLEARAPRLRTTVATLDAGGAAAEWQVVSGTSAAFVWGAILTAFGAAALTVTAAFVAYALTSAPGDSYNEMMGTILGVTGGVISAAALAGGIALLASNTNRVEVALAPTGAALRLRM